jgi:D-beta-D-heptose 7-phosphate kinase/D-beta-D-heptose 1-phosphate adenosyltransferase
MNIDTFTNKRVLLIGDYCMDEFFEGEANSVSPEAPVLRVLVESIKTNPGMTGNITVGVRALGAETYAAGIIGDDETSKKLISEFKDKGINTEGMFFQEKRLTPKFSRVVVGGKKFPKQSAIRFDVENTEAVSSVSLQKLFNFIERLKDSLDAIIVADYDEVGKGVIRKELLDKITSLAKKNNIVLVGDSRENLRNFNGFPCVVPNIAEAESVCTGKNNSISEMSKELISKLKLDAVLITRDRDGMEITTRDGKNKAIPALAKRVVDVNGVGDTVTCAFTLSLCSGLDYLKAAKVASYAAAIAVSKPMLAVVTLSELREAVKNEE